MADLYSNKGSGLIGLLTEAQEFNQTAVQDELANWQALDGISDDAKEFISNNGFPVLGGADPLGAFNDLVQGHIDRLEDIDDYFSYTLENTIVDERKFAWFSPTHESFTGDELGGNLATRATDADNGTFWRFTLGVGASLTMKVRDYSKKIIGIRFRHPSSASREQITTIEVRAAENILNIDDPGNLIDTITPAWGSPSSAWVEHDFLPAEFKSAKYVKLTGLTASGHGSEGQIREIEIKVGTQ